MEGLDASGKRSTRRPLASRYSVMPSTEVTFSGADKGRARGAAGFVGAGAGWPKAGMADKRAERERARARMLWLGSYGWGGARGAPCRFKRARGTYDSAPWLSSPLESGDGCRIAQLPSHGMESWVPGAVAAVAAM